MGRILRRTDTHTLRRLRQPRDKLFIDRFQHDDPGTGGAFLSLIPGERRQDSTYGFIQIRGVINDDGVFSTHFRNDMFDVGLAGHHLRGLLDDSQSGFFRSGKGNDVDTRMGNEGLSHVRPAREEAQHTVREPGFFIEFKQEVPHHGRTFRRLEQHGVARDQGRRDHPRGNGQRKIPWRNDHGHPAWQPFEVVHFTRFLPQELRLFQVTHLSGVEFEKIYGLRHVGIRLSPGFSGFKNFPRGQVKSALSHAFRHGTEVRGTRAGRRGTPGLKRFKRVLNHRFHFCGGITGNPGDDFVRPAGIDRNQFVFQGPNHWRHREGRCLSKLLFDPFNGLGHRVTRGFS